MSQENQRIKVPFEHRFDQFYYEEEDRQADLQNRQYFRYYDSRVQALKGRILARAREEVDKSIKITPLSKLVPNRPALICGVTIKRCKNRPSVFDEFKKQDFDDEDELWDLEDAEEEAELNAENPYARVETLCSSADTLEIEDDKQRLPLVGADINKDHFVTGNILGFYGAKDANEDFVVEKVICPQLAPQIPWPSKVSDSYIMFISGFNLNAQIAKNEWKMAAFHQLADFLQGNSLDPQQCDLGKKVGRVIFVGDTVRISTKDYTRYMVTKLGQSQTYEPNGLEQLDRLLEDMTMTVPVTLMPGPNDICDALWPQRPILKKSLLRNKKYYSNCDTVTNPYSFDYDGVRFLGSSGQNIDDMIRYTKGKSTIELMKDLLEKSHLCPTCPDTIDGHPYVGKDPLVIKETPHVFFVGNQPKFASEMVKLSDGCKVLMLSLPRFSQTHEVYLFNPKTLETLPFEVFIDEELIERTHFDPDDDEVQEMDVDE
ncbi:unnamed protein product [Bursaphelenchus xylophilus]|nr:unnamed protein product [Bursaphelenchus xylophilus]CAG9114175.1 unnamed protein product [Bursaphelenchus xylophilus]